MDINSPEEWANAAHDFLLNDDEMWDFTYQGKCVRVRYIEDKLIAYDHNGKKLAWTDDFKTFKYDMWEYFK